ncbi:transmembrane channel-like 7 [Phytophthora boehmeriae]|uniref:Transmembrane channel-like 7 n=1 Tax=Phytophthora boehmeriae TaxID=109152 RepID=A0A8T1X7T7_9STRA|nr:transmembrane channel-like 7 [Phytophthora boehmeriae]
MQVDDADEVDDVPGFSGMRPAVNFEAIEASVNRQIARITAFPDDKDVWRLEDDEDHEEDSEITSGGFVSHQPQTLVAKKLKLLEKQLQHRDKMLQRFQVERRQAEVTIANLQSELQLAQQEFTAAQEEWEEEKETILRFRGSGGGKGNSTMMQLQLGMGRVRLGRAGSRMTEEEAQRQREMRQQMLNGAADAQEMLDAELGDGTDRAAVRGIRLQWKKLKLFLRRRLYPFTTDIRQIEAQFGSSVTSYFRFFGWIIMTFIVMSIPCFVLFVLHIIFLTSQIQSVKWTEFAGVAPTFLQLSGYFPDEALMYSVVLVSMEVLLLLVTLRKWISEDRMAKTIQAIENASEKPKYSSILLNAWDFSIITTSQASDLKKTILEQVKLAMEEEKRAETIKTRTKMQKYKLYARRFIAFVFYMTIQAASWYLIIRLTTQSSEIQAKLAAYAAFFAPYASTIVPAAVTIINAILPKLISLLTAMEKWDDVGFAIKAMVTRLYLAKILNVLIQVFSFALLLDPQLLTSKQSVWGLFTFEGATIRQNIMVEFKSSACRAEQASAGLLTLVVTDFSVSKAMAISSPLISVIVNKLKSLLRRHREKRAAMKKAISAKVVPGNVDTGTPEMVKDKELPDFGSNVELPISTSLVVQETTDIREPVELPAEPLLTKSEFLVPQKMVALLYSCTIALVAIPLAPTTALLALLLHIANFKFDKFILMHFQKKPANPWSAKDAGSFFIKFYFTTVVIFLGFTHFFLLNTHLPKKCELQDSLEPSDNALCVTNSYDATQGVCTIDPTRPSSAYFLNGKECTSGYPRCICEFACGPFIEVATGYTVMVDYITSSSISSAFYSLMLGSKVVPWTFLFILLLAIFFLRNSLTVFVMTTLQREQNVALTISSLRRRIKQLENRLRLQKIGGSHAHETDNSGNPAAPLNCTQHGTMT